MCVCVWILYTKIELTVSISPSAFFLTVNGVRVYGERRRRARHVVYVGRYPGTVRSPETKTSHSGKPVVL